MYRPVTARFFLPACLLALVAACGDKPEPAGDAYGDTAGVLQYVDADTPFLFASLEPAPDDVYEKIEPRTDRLLDSYRRIIRASLEEELRERREGAEYEGELEEADVERVVALVDRVLGMFSSEGMEEAGLSRDSAIALYGVGLLPVLRVELADVAAFEESLVELQAEAGVELESAVVDSQPYRFAGDEKARVVIAVVDGHMVGAIVPTALSEDGLKSVLGMAKPARSIADSGKLAGIAETYGYTSNGAGFLDLERIAGTFIDQPEGLDAELLAMTGHDPSTLSDVCKAELRGLAGIAPRIVTGYTEFNAERMASNTVIELRSDIAEGLSALTAPVPGLGRDHGGMVSFGMSIDLQAARDFYSGRLDALEATPYECELLANLQAGAAQGRAVLEQPVPPIVYGLHGFMAIVDDVEGLNIQTKQPPTSVDMRFLLASDNAPGLLAMGAMFSPELAALNLQANGEAVRFESPQLQATPIDAAWLAMTDSAIGLAVGEDGEDEVTRLLDLQAGDPPPLFAMSMDAGRYYHFIADAVTLEQADQRSPEMASAVGDMMQVMGELIDRVSLSVNLTARGIEIPTETTLAD